MHTSAFSASPYLKLYPFGYGLSYSKNQVDNLKLSADMLQPGGTLSATVTLRNTTARDGDQVVQL
jgi:beta-glucosidase